MGYRESIFQKRLKSYRFRNAISTNALSEAEEIYNLLGSVSNHAVSHESIAVDLNSAGLIAKET